MIKCEDKRILDPETLQTALKDLNIEFEVFEKNKLVDDEQYLVFGSFSVAESFLKETGFEK